jgi:uncharacterized membrane protein YdbT with pleckstrin-like domain
MNAFKSADLARYLMPREIMVFGVRQHPARLLPPLTAAVGGLLAAIAVGRITEGVESAQYVVWILAGFLIARFLVDAINWSVNYVALTKERFILTSGILDRKVMIIPLPEARGLTFERSAGGRLFGYGVLSFESDGKAKTILDYIPYPEQVYIEVYGMLHPSDSQEGSKELD